MANSKQLDLRDDEEDYPDLPYRHRRYYFNWRGRFVHLVLSMRHHTRDGNYSHSSVTFLCGNSGFISKDRPASLYTTPPEHKPLCERCAALWAKRYPHDPLESAED